MSGIQYVVDDKGKKTAGVIDLKEHGELWEDFHDSLSVRERANEPRESFDAVKRILVRQGKLRG